MKIAINGFGRIGRPSLKIALEKENVEVAAINDLSNIEDLAYLLKYDTAYGVYEKKIEIQGDKLIVGDQEILVLAEKDPSKLPWGELGVDVVLECTGFFKDKVGAGKHLEAGAKEVVISAPTKDESIKTIVKGVNDNEITADDHIISNASCTTNCLAPMVKVLNDKFGVENALMSTIHSYTSTQNLVDGVGKKDKRRGRAAGQNIIPTSTGAVIATTLTLPELAGKFDGMAYRVPTIVGSITDLTVVLKSKTTTDEVNDAFIEAMNNELRSIMKVTNESLVSHDIVGDSHSVIVQSDLTKVVGGNLVKIVGWYDNEWGYSNRLVELGIMLVNR